MNKKFSTLVAALLVTGGSFAMVSQYAGSALAESPLAMAAAANLRATDVASEATAAIGVGANGSEWTLTVNDGKGALSWGNFNLGVNEAGNLVLSKGVAAAVVKLDDHGHVKIGDKYLSISGTDLTLAATDANAVKLFGSDDQAKTTLENGAVQIAIENSEAGTFNEASTKYVKVTGEYAPEAVEYKTIAQGSTLAATATKFTIANLNSTNTYSQGNFNLKVGESYVKAIEDGHLVLTGDEGEALWLSYWAEASSTACHLLGTNGLYFNIDESFAIISNNGNAAYKLFTTASTPEAIEGSSSSPAHVDVTNLSEGLPVYIAAGKNEGDKVLFLGEPTIPNLSVAAKGVDETVQTLTAATGTTGVYLFAGEDCALAAGENGAVVLSDEDGLEFYLENGYLKSGNQYLVNNNGLKLSASSEGALVAYDKTTGAVVTSLSADDEIIVAEAVDAVKSMSADKQVIAKITATANLVDGATYMIKGATTSLAMVRTETGYQIGATSKFFNEGSALRAALNNDEVVSINNVLWKASKKIVAGKAVYSFVNVDTGLPLAFAENEDKDGVVFNIAGDYNTFMLENESLVFTYTSTGDAGTKPYYVNPGTGEVSDAPATVTFATAAPVETGNDAASVEKAVDLLNKTYGTGSGFGMMFKDRALNDEKVKDVTLESNPFTDNTIITAVQGKDFRNVSSTVTGTDLSTKMFLKVSGSYPLTSATATAEDQLKAFRGSKFIAVDTIRYSKNISDAVANNFFKYTVVSGAEMITGNGVVYAGGSADDFNRGKKYNGLTRRIENAEFTIKQAAGASVADPIEFIVDAYMPAADNGNKPALLGHSDPINDLKINIKNFLGKNYVGAYATSWDYIYVGLNNDVDYQTINGIVTLTSRNYDSDGQVYATDEAGTAVTTVLAKYVATDKPEGQFLATGGWINANGAIAGFTFTNRESGVKKYFAGFKKTDKANIYASTNSNDTIEIKAASTLNEFDGYANYKKDVLENTQYVLKVVSNAAGIKDIYISEDHNKDHSLGLNADTLEAANFKLIKFERAAKMSDYLDYGDTVFVSNETDNKNLYSYVAVDKYGNKYYDVKEDRVVAFTYAIYNADNGEYLDVKKGQGSTLGNFYYCNPNKKYNTAKDADIQRFIIKEKANGAVQLIPVNLHNSDFEGSAGNLPRKQQFTTKALTKLYAGISDNKLYQQEKIYKIADNDLFTIQQIGAPLYRTLDVTGNVRIYKEGMPNIALFAESADKALVSGQNLLGMEHKADADLNKTMFSFLLDTAYVDRANNYTPQYLLAIDATTTPGGKWCETHQSATCEHAVEIPGYVKGSYLVSLADSADAVAASQAHKNPYRYDGYDRLGFVKATHIGDALAIERGKAVKADTLSLKDGLTKASFALQIVDQATQSFALKNADGYVKWLNGVPVLVKDFALAEVLNIEATENAATANESIAAEGVQVIAGKGVVTVQGAAGKVVTVANILGQTIANQVAASDNVTIAAPAGVVVVTVDGEATKVVVK